MCVCVWCWQTLPILMQKGYPKSSAIRIVMRRLNVAACTVTKPNEMRSHRVWVGWSLVGEADNRKKIKSENWWPLPWKDTRPCIIRTQQQRTNENKYSPIFELMRRIRPFCWTLCNAPYTIPKDASIWAYTMRTSSLHVRQTISMNPLHISANQYIISQSQPACIEFLFTGFCACKDVWAE